MKVIASIGSYCTSIILFLHYKHHLLLIVTHILTFHILMWTLHIIFNLILTYAFIDFGDSGGNITLNKTIAQYCIGKNSFKVFVF